MNLKAVVVVPLVLVVLLASGCTTSDGDTAGTALPLEGTPWTLVSYAVDGVATEVPDEVTVTALFEDGQLSGSSGCNTYSAEYTLDGTTLSIAPIAGTLIACDEPAASTETAYLGALSQAVGYTSDASGMSLTDSAGDVVLTFAEAE